MEIIGIIALLIIFAGMLVSGYASLMLVYGFGSSNTFDYIYSWSLFLSGIVGFALTLYFNIDISVKG